MKGTPSAIHYDSSAWADTLRTRALDHQAPHNLTQLLNRFQQQSPFYRSRTGQETDWEKIIPLEKHELENIPVNQDKTVRASRTSGTTGLQVKIFNSRRERLFRRALLYRPQLFYPLPADVRQVVFVDGAECATAAAAPKLFSYGRQNYRTWFAGAGSDTAKIAKLLNDIRPQLIRGISSGIVRFIEAHGSSMKALGARIIAPGGEFLRDEWRSTMGQAFGAAVLDRYGSTESGAIAWQCPFCQRYHANTDETILEADPGGLLATPLFSGSQPLLRYRLGDIVALSSPATDCQIRLPILTIEQARRDDWIIDGAGNKVSPLSLQFEKIQHLVAWRLHQDCAGALSRYYESP